MKTEIKQLLRDLRAAVMLWRPEAVNIALDGLLEMPGVSANDRMSDGFVEQVILPVGQVLSELPAAWLRPLLIHELAVGRALGAAALARRFVKGDDSTHKDLRRPGSDPRPDVRLSLGRSLSVVCSTNPEKVLNLGVNWVSQPFPRLRYTALVFLPGLAYKYLSEIMDLLSSLGEDEDREVKAALVDALTALGRGAYAEPVLGLLSTLSAYPNPNSWVICRTLTASWVKEYPIEVKSILQEIQPKIRDASQLANTLKALKRHGMDIAL